jgi:oligopeptide/dipeptide ABC transporter ATP-binding protein
MPDTFLDVERLAVHFPIRRGILRRVVGAVRAVDEVSFRIGRGETLGLVGESGCGKTTTGRAILRLVEPTGGRVRLDGTDLTHLPGRALRGLRRRMQIVFQDPYGSLNPRLTVRAILEEGLVIHRMGDAAERQRRMRDALDRTGMPATSLDRYPHEFSGGQRQRIAIARALVLEPEFVVLDEPVSALDVSIQAQVVNLLADLRRDLGLTYLFISHDLSVVEHLSDRVAVMYLGRIVEMASAPQLYAGPLHPYTLALFSAVPSVDPARRRTRIVLSGDVPSPARPPAGCRFHPRCPLAEADCRTIDPPATEIAGHTVHCHVAARELERSGGDAAAAAARIAAAMAAAPAAAATPPRETAREADPLDEPLRAAGVVGPVLVIADNPAITRRGPAWARVFGAVGMMHRVRFWEGAAEAGDIRSLTAEAAGFGARLVVASGGAATRAVAEAVARSAGLPCVVDPLDAGGSGG